MHAGVVKNLAHVPQEIGVHALTGRKIDVDDEMVGARKLLVPGPQLTTGLVQHPRANRYDQPCFLRCRNELGGEHESAPGMVPAQEGFEA